MSFRLNLLLPTTGFLFPLFLCKVSATRKMLGQRIPSLLLHKRRRNRASVQCGFAGVPRFEARSSSAALGVSDARATFNDCTRFMSRLGKHSRADTCSCHCAVTFLRARRGPCLAALGSVRCGVRVVVCVTAAQEASIVVARICRCASANGKTKPFSGKDGRASHTLEVCVRRYTRVYRRYLNNWKVHMCYAWFDTLRILLPNGCPFSRGHGSAIL